MSDNKDIPDRTLVWLTTHITNGNDLRVDMHNCPNDILEFIVSLSIGFDGGVLCKVANEVLAERILLEKL